MLSSASFILLIVCTFVTVAHAGSSFVITCKLFRSICTPIIRTVLGLKLSMMLKCCCNLTKVVKKMVVDLLFVTCN